MLIEPALKRVLFWTRHPRNVTLAGTVIPPGIVTPAQAGISWLHSHPSGERYPPANVIPGNRHSCAGRNLFFKNK